MRIHQRTIQGTRWCAAAYCLAWLCAREPLPAAPGDLIGYIPACSIAPQDIAADSDGTYWVTAFLDNKICHFGPGLKTVLGEISYPVAGSYPTGIAHDPRADTLYVTDALSGAITEIAKDGTPTGTVLRPAFEQPPGTASPSPRGMAFDPTGDAGKGSIYVVEASASILYEITLEGLILREIFHPDDPDGFPGKGLSASVTDVDIIHDAAGTKVEGYYLSGGRLRISDLRRIDADGVYRGLSVPIGDAGGNISGFFRLPFPRPDNGVVVDSYICVVESNARFAVLEGGEPTFREVTGFQCTLAGRDVHLTWERFEDYDRIEVSRGCEILATLPGTATSWTHTFETDGVHELLLTVTRGDHSWSPPPCTLVVGAGRILASAPIGGELPVDSATDGEGLILVSDARTRKILLFDRTFQPAGELQLGPDFVTEKEILTGVAFDPATRRIFAFNATKSTVGIFNDTEELLGTFDAKLPNLEEDPLEDPDLGLVLGMSFDRAGDGGNGSLWVLEADRDWIYEIGVQGPRQGEVLRNFPHPYLAVDPPPVDSPYGASTSGLAEVAGGSPNELYLTGGALRDLREKHIFRVDKRTGAVIPGSAIPTDAIRVETGSTFLTIESLVDGGNPRLLALAITGPEARLMDIDPGLPPVQPPSFLTARQAGLADEAFLTFVSNGPYDSIEVHRDCSKVATLAPDATSYLDRDVPSGLHVYAVRGVRGGVASDFIRASTRTGLGAVLQRVILWPTRSPQQIAQDPVDGSFAVATNWPNDERKVYHFDRSLQLLSTRDSVVQEGWEIAAIAIRAHAERELNYITWKQPVPIGEVSSQRFFLVKESLAGAALGEREIFPPRPTNGFITFPTGLTWREASDTFYFLERNSKTFVEMSAAGDLLRTFPHPDPPFQNFVFNLGAAFSPERGTLFITGSDRQDFKITRVMEMSLDGRLTGVEIPVGIPGSTVTGIAVRADDLVLASTGSFSELIRVKAFSRPSSAFIRGDVDGSQEVNLTDVIVTLNHLFRGGPVPACEDAADADDSGEVNLTDPITTLVSLFQGGGSLPPPYPESGFDPTPDGLTCF